MDMTTFCKATSAFVGAMVSTSILYPTEVTKTKVQAFMRSGSLDQMTEEEREKAEAYTNVFKALIYTWRKEGYKALFPPWAQGYFSKIVDAGFFNFVFYFWYEVIKSNYVAIAGDFGYVANLTVGAVAGACNQLTTLPLQNHSARMQCADDKTKGNWDTAVDMYNESGIAGFYKGAWRHLVIASGHCNLRSLLLLPFSPCRLSSVPCALTKRRCESHGSGQDKGMVSQPI
jgi:hypothetical protein